MLEFEIATYFESVVLTRELCCVNDTLLRSNAIRIYPFDFIYRICFISRRSKLDKLAMCGFQAPKFSANIFQYER